MPSNVPGNPRAGQIRGRDAQGAYEPRPSGSLGCYTVRDWLTASWSQVHLTATSSRRRPGLPTPSSHVRATREGHRETQRVTFAS